MSPQDSRPVGIDRLSSALTPVLPSIHGLTDASSSAPREAGSLDTMTIQRLFIYPVKSMLPVEVSMAEITSEGLRFDRQYVLIKASPKRDADSPAEHITIKTTFRMCLFQPSISEDWSRLTITHTLARPESSITIPLTPSPLSCVHSESYLVSIFGTRAPGVDMGDEAADFFGKHLDMAVRLLYISGDGSRDIPGAVALRQPHLSLKTRPTADNAKSSIQRIRFADASPLLVTSTASADDALSRLPPAVRDQDVIIRLRPNIHVDVGPSVKAWDEDDWSKMFVFSPDSDLHKATIRCIFRTPRCLSLNVDLKTGKAAPRDQQLYGLLAKDRRTNSAIPHKPVFGQYATAGPIGAILRVGDEIRVISRVPPQEAGKK